MMMDDVFNCGAVLLLSLLVHCNTGNFVTLDMIMQQMKAESTLSPCTQCIKNGGYGS